MKIFRRALSVTLIICLALIVAALFFRIYIGEHYPKDSTRIVFTPALEEYYSEVDDFKVYTQKLRAPYDDNKDGNFFADGLYLVPDADHLQITLRYSDGALDNVAAKYKLEDALVRADGLFRYELRASYNTTAEGSDYRTYESSYISESDAYMYHYTKLAFDGVVFEGASWMCVDIYLVGQEECFGSLIVYEASFEFDGELYPYEIQEKRIPKGDLPS